MKAEISKTWVLFSIMFFLILFSNVINSDSSKRNFILIGSTSKKLKALKADIELAFKNKGAYVQLEFLEIKMSVKDTNPSKRL
jgi:hypothetical protein